MGSGLNTAGAPSVTHAGDPLERLGERNAEALRRQQDAQVADLDLLGEEQPSGTPMWKGNRPERVLNLLGEEPPERGRRRVEAALSALPRELGIRRGGQRAAHGASALRQAAPDLGVIQLPWRKV